MAYRQTPETRRRLAERRMMILKATRELIAEVGFRGVRSRLVAEKAGISEGTIYRYFPTMTALYAEVFRTAALRELAASVEAADRPGPHGERLAAAVRVHVERALRRPRLAHALLAEPVSPEIEAVRLDCRHRFHLLFSEILQDGIAAGEFIPFDTELAAACITGALDEAIIWPFAKVADDARDKPVLVDFMVGFCMAGLDRFRTAGAGGLRRPA